MLLFNRPYFLTNQSPPGFQTLALGVTVALLTMVSQACAPPGSTREPGDSAAGLTAGPVGSGTLAANGSPARNPTSPVASSVADASPNNAPGPSRDAPSPDPGVIGGCALPTGLLVAYLEDEGPERGRIELRWPAPTNSTATLAHLQLSVSGSTELSQAWVDLRAGVHLTELRIQDLVLDGPGPIEAQVSLELPCTDGTLRVQELRASLMDPLQVCPVATPDSIATNEAIYYECIEGWLEGGMGCGSEGYPTGYGAVYARRFFRETRPTLSEAGQRWLDATLICLQESLRDEAYLGISCDQLGDRAFGHHAHCYAESGVCLLGLPDILQVARTIALPDLLDEHGRQQFLGLLPECGEAYVETAREVLAPTP